MFRQRHLAAPCLVQIQLQRQIESSFFFSTGRSEADRVETSWLCSGWTPDQVASLGGPSGKSLPRERWVSYFQDSAVSSAFLAGSCSSLPADGERDSKAFPWRLRHLGCLSLASLFSHLSISLPLLCAVVRSGAGEPCPPASPAASHPGVWGCWVPRGQDPWQSWCSEPRYTASSCPGRADGGKRVRHRVQFRPHGLADAPAASGSQQWGSAAAPLRPLRRLSRVCGTFCDPLVFCVLTSPAEGLQQRKPSKHSSRCLREHKRVSS